MRSVLSGYACLLFFTSKDLYQPTCAVLDVVLVSGLYVLETLQQAGPKGRIAQKQKPSARKKWPTENRAMLYGLPSAGPLIGSRHRSAAPTTTVLRRSALFTTGHQNFIFPNHPAQRSGLCLDTAGLSGLYRSCSSWRDGPRCFAKSISSFCSRNKNLVQHGACHRVQLVRH
jgi:hypothetical protein